MKTVKVKIAVAVDRDGDWNACGWGKGSQKPDDNCQDAMSIAVDPVQEGEARYWVEAELAIPEMATATIQGEVTQAA